MSSFTARRLGWYPFFIEIPPLLLKDGKQQTGIYFAALAKEIRTSNWAIDWICKSQRKRLLQNSATNFEKKG